jgi:PAS domain-containing protein
MRRWTRFTHPEDLAETVQRWSRHRFRRADGIHRSNLSRAWPMRDTKGTITTWISSNTDIDEVSRVPGKSFLSPA